MENNRKRKPATQLTLPEITSSSSKKQRNENDYNNNQKRAGIITHVDLKNFMCHSHLSVKFENNVTIMTGKNGSGKSAVLTALIVGLGGKASVTNRGTSIKGFVKAGKNSATVEIQIYNEGPMAYRPRIYGKRITIIRHFTASGSSSYKVKSEIGKIISTKVNEIKLITTSLNIQVDNPVCILTQDTSRNFLHSNDPKHKFTLFIRATGLETLAEEYKKLYTNKENSINLLDEKSNNHHKMQEELKRLRIKIDNHKSMASMRDKIKQLQTEMIWSKVKDLEEILDEHTSAIAALQKKLDSVQDSKRKKIEELHNIKDKVRNLQHSVAEIKSTIDIQTRPARDLQNMLEELRQKYMDKRREKRLLQQSIASKTQDIEMLQQQIDNANENMSRVEREKMERLRNLTTMEEKLKGMEDHIQTVKNDLFQLRSDLSRREDEESNLQEEISHIDRKASQEMSNLDAMKQESGNTLLRYGRNIPKIVEMIHQHQHKFKQLPRGPLGNYIKLKDKKWAVAVEGFVSPSMLSAFTVDNRQDNELLVQIINKCCTDGRKPTVITSKFISQKHDVRKYLVYAPNGCVSLYDAIEVEDPVVSNCLVDQMSIEGVLLLPDDGTAMKYLSDAKHVPKNCRQGITVKGDKYFPDPNYRTYCSNYHRAQYLQVDASEYIQQMEASIENLIQQKQVLQRQMASFRAEMQTKMQRRNQLEEKIKKLTVARTQVRKQIEEIKASAEPEVANVQELENEMSEIKSILRNKSAQIGKIDEETTTIKSQLDENERKHEKLKKVIRDLETRIDPLQAEVRESISRQRELSLNETADDRKIEEMGARLAEAQSEKRGVEANIEQRTANATAIGSRPNQIRKVPDINADLKDTESAVRRVEADSDNLEEVQEKFLALNEKCKKVSMLIDSLKIDVSELQSATSMRTRQYKAIESYFVTYIKHSFKRVLELRQFKGTIEINMEEKTLELVVIPQQGSQGLTTTSNLSGGERSFSTVAFLYSLWQCMEFPFYYLDEFDVYMDKQNRTKVIDILLHYANSCPHLQFVFLTPQDVSFIDRNVSILRMQDPERRQVES